MSINAKWSPRVGIVTNEFVRVVKVAQSVVEELSSKSVVVNSGRKSAVSCSSCLNDASENMMWVVRRKMRVHVLVVWLLINLVVNFAMRHGVVVEGDS